MPGSKRRRRGAWSVLDPRTAIPYPANHTHTHTHTHTHSHTHTHTHTHTLYTQHFTPYTIHYTMYTTHCTPGREFLIDSLLVRPRAGATQGPSVPASKVIFGRFRQLLAINAPQMAPSTGQWLQVRVKDTTTKGLLWSSAASAGLTRRFLTTRSTNVHQTTG